MPVTPFDSEPLRDTDSITFYLLTPSTMPGKYQACSKYLLNRGKN